LMEAQETGDVQGLIYIIRSGLRIFGCSDLGLLRNLGNITAKNLYNRGYAGYHHLWPGLRLEQNS